MILFARSNANQFFAIESTTTIHPEVHEKLEWLLNATILPDTTLTGLFVGPRKEMLTPWCTNAIEIMENMGIDTINRIEELTLVNDALTPRDKMLQVIFENPGQDIFFIAATPTPIIEVEDIASFNQKEGLALSDEEINYLNSVSQKLDRKLTDSEVFGFSQVNSEHCRHKIFNGIFVIDGVEKETSLFKLIKKTTETHPNTVVSAYKDNVAFIQGPIIEQFAPSFQETSSEFETIQIESVLSIKAETHNFPTTVEPFNGAATGAGGEIRDRIGGGKASMPLAGTAVYMTPYSRVTSDRNWENATPSRNWLYQTPLDLLIKASNGASDFGNKFGQPLIAGSVLTFEHFEKGKKWGYDKVIMLAGGVGYGYKKDAIKGHPKAGDKIVVMGGDNYRIGMGGAAVSSVDTGEFSSGIELNAIQRSNPEMQKRVYNAIRAMAESNNNPIISIHDHGAGGHLNCLSELVEATGGKIEINKLPVGDPTLSFKEIIGNESQERMGLVINQNDMSTLEKVAQRERAPFYVVGECTGDNHFTIENSKGQNPIDLELADFFGNPPKTIMDDKTIQPSFDTISYDLALFEEYLNQVLRLEAVACKDWLTNKVDRSVTGKVAKQQTCGEIQLPLNNCGVMALDYRGVSGIATSIGHAPVASLSDEKAGARLAIAEALLNIVFAPLKNGIKSVSLSANWMWPCRNEGEDARLYNAVKAVSDFSIDLGINIPTGKDSLSMVQKYKDGEKVLAPGSVIISAGGEVSDIRKVVSPNLQKIESTELLYVDFAGCDLELGGSSFAQIINKIGDSTPDIMSGEVFKKSFDAIQDLIAKDIILAGHDVSSGGLITTLLEMCFPTTAVGLFIDGNSLGEKDFIKVMFSENPALILQVKDAAEVQTHLEKLGVYSTIIGNVLLNNRTLTIYHNAKTRILAIDELRDVWYETSYQLDTHQSTPALALERFKNYKQQPLSFTFSEKFKGSFEEYNINPDRKTKSGIKAAIIREKGVNGDREMAYMLHLAGFDVKDVHMTDLITGRENLQDVNFIVFCGGFSNSDVLGSAKGWAGAFKYNEKAKKALEDFYARPDTLSLGVCNGCQLAMELGLLHDSDEMRPKMIHNNSHKFESGFVKVSIPTNNSILFSSLSGFELGIWIAHGEGKFQFPAPVASYDVILKYAHSGYPGNPNGSPENIAGISSKDGRHVAMMPHLERAFFPWQCPNYPTDRLNDDCTPWLEAFVNAKNWIINR